MNEHESTIEYGTIDGYRIAYEHGAPGTSWNAFSDDVPGCFAFGATREETEQLMREAIAEHLADDDDTHHIVAS